MKNLKDVYESILDDDDELMADFELTPEEKFNMLKQEGYLDAERGEVVDRKDWFEIKTFNDGAYFSNLLTIHDKFPKQSDLFEKPLERIHCPTVLIYEKDKMNPQEFADKIYCNGFVSKAKETKDMYISVGPMFDRTGYESVIFCGAKSFSKTKVEFGGHIFPKDIMFINSGYIDIKNKLRSNAFCYKWDDKTLFDDKKVRSMINDLFEPVDDSTENDIIAWFTNATEDRNTFHTGQCPFKMREDVPIMRSLFPFINRFTKHIQLSNEAFTIEFVYKSEFKSSKYENHYDYPSDKDWQVHVYKGKIYRSLSGLYEEWL